jgi:hypothetical protein
MKETFLFMFRTRFNYLSPLDRLVMRSAYAIGYRTGYETTLLEGKDREGFADAMGRYLTETVYGQGYNWA